MKNLIVLLISAFAFSAQAGWTTTVYFANTTDDAEIASIISGINSGRIYVAPCGGQQRVYGYNKKSNSGSFVIDANGNPRPVGGKTHIKVRCQE